MKILSLVRGWGRLEHNIRSWNIGKIAFLQRDGLLLIHRRCGFFSTCAYCKNSKKLCTLILDALKGQYKNWPHPLTMKDSMYTPSHMAATVKLAQWSGRHTTKWQPRVVMMSTSVNPSDTSYRRNSEDDHSRRSVAERGWIAPILLIVDQSGSMHLLWSMRLNPRCA